MANNKLILRTLQSPYINDITRNSVLSWDDVDNNFLHLKGLDVLSASTSGGTTLVLTKNDGTILTADLTAIATTATTDYWTSGSSGTNSIKANNSTGLDATANFAVAQGITTLATGQGSHAEGINSIASNSAAHAEGDSTIASGISSHAEGYFTIAKGDYSHVEGASTIANGTGSHAEGISSTAHGDYSHAEGVSTIANGTSSHAEGVNTIANGVSSHAEGYFTEAISSYGSHAEGGNTKALGDYSHAEGNLTIASGTSTHAEGSNTTASGNYSHAEGNNTIASGTSAHGEGSSTIAQGDFSHAEGYLTIASGTSTHAEGSNTTAGGLYSHSEGASTIASGTSSHAEGSGTTAIGIATHAEGYFTEAISSYGSHAEGGNTKALGDYSHAEGNLTIANGTSSHTEGASTIGSGVTSHAEGSGTTAIGIATHAEGASTIAQGDYSHAEGYYTKALGINSHAEGGSSTAQGDYSHVEGNVTTATGIASHAEGSGTIAIGNYSHGEGNNTIAQGVYSHAEGASTIGSGVSSHAEGGGTTASGNYSHAEGYQSIASGYASHSEGGQNTSSGDYSHVGGYISKVLSHNSFIHSNSSIINTGATNSAILGGSGNTINSDIQNSIILGGSGLSATSGNTVYVPKLNISTATTNNSITSLLVLNSDGTVQTRDASTISGSPESHLTDSYWVSGSSGTDSVKTVNNTAIVSTGNYSLAEGANTTSTGIASHAEGSGTTAMYNYTHAEGSQTTACGIAAHSEGFANISYGDYSHTQGNNTIASGTSAHAEGSNTRAYGEYSHAEGNNTTANGYASHSEGFYTTASGESSHASGKYSIALSNYSFIHSNSSIINTGATNSAILGGSGNTINPNVVNSVILGCHDITATTSNTVYACGGSFGSITATTLYGDGSNITNINSSINLPHTQIAYGDIDGEITSNPEFIYSNTSFQVGHPVNGRFFSATSNNLNLYSTDWAGGLYLNAAPDEFILNDVISEVQYFYASSTGIRFHDLYTFPTINSVGEQYLKNDGTGNLSWGTVTSGTGGGGDNFSKTIYVDGGTNYESYDNLSNARMGHTDMPYKTLKTAADRAGGFVIQGAMAANTNVITGATLIENLIVGDIISYNANTADRFLGIVVNITKDTITLRPEDICIPGLAPDSSIRVYPKGGFKDIVVMSGDYTYTEELEYGSSTEYYFGAVSLYRPGVRWYFMPGAVTTLLTTSTAPLFMVTKDFISSEEATLLNDNGYNEPSYYHLLPKGDIFGQGIFKGEEGCVGIYESYADYGQDFEPQEESPHVGHTFEFDTISCYQPIRPTIYINNSDTFYQDAPYSLSDLPTFNIKGNAIEITNRSAIECYNSLVNINVINIIASSNVYNAVYFSGCRADTNIQRISGNPSIGLYVINSLGGKINLIDCKSSLNNIVVGSTLGVDYDQYNFTSIETHCDTVLVNSGRVNINGKVGFITLGNNVTEGSYDSSPDVYCEWVLYGMNVGSACRLYVDVFGTKESLVASDSLAEGGTSSLIKGSVYIRDCNLYRRIFRVGMPTDYKAKALLDIEYLHSKYDFSYSFIQMEGNCIIKVKDIFFDDTSNYQDSLFREASDNISPSDIVIRGSVAQDNGCLCKKAATGQLVNITARGAYIQPTLFDETTNTILYIHGTLTTPKANEAGLSVESIYGKKTILDYNNVEQVVNIQYGMPLNEDEQYA